MFAALLADEVDVVGGCACCCKLGLADITPLGAWCWLDVGVLVAGDDSCCCCDVGRIDLEAASLIRSKRVSSPAGKGVTTNRIEYDIITVPKL